MYVCVVCVYKRRFKRAPLFPMDTRVVFVKEDPKGCPSPSLSMDRLKDTGV